MSISSITRSSIRRNSRPRWRSAAASAAPFPRPSAVALRLSWARSGARRASLRRAFAVASECERSLAALHRRNSLQLFLANVHGYWQTSGGPSRADELRQHVANGNRHPLI